MTEDEMVRQHHQLNGQEPEQSPGDSGQRTLACCSPGGHRVRQDLATEQQQQIHYIIRSIHRGLVMC